MNVLFFNDFVVSPYKGGTERASISTAKSLKEITGSECYFLYAFDVEGFEPYYWDSTKKLGNDWCKCIEENLINWKIEIVIIQGSHYMVPIFRSVINRLGLNIKIIFAHHFAPGFEVNFDSFNQYWSNYKKQADWKNVKGLFECCRVFIDKYLNNYKYHKYYKQSYKQSDAVVLLSKSYVRGFMRFGRIIDSSKFYSIPNALSFDPCNDESFIDQKDNTVIIVSRMDEISKRISLALKAWSIIKKKEISSSWKLQIIGHGEDLEAYKEYVRHEKLEGVEFLGCQDPFDYYRKASISLMTSKQEGWGITLTESLQMGVVPVAFDSYSSLHDIIIDQYNGFIVPNNDIRKFANCVLNLMENKENRIKLAKQCIKSSVRFSSSAVGLMWQDLLNKITS